jgi:hypothetical protein
VHHQITAHKRERRGMFSQLYDRGAASFPGRDLLQYGYLARCARAVPAQRRSKIFQ